VESGGWGGGERREEGGGRREEEGGRREDVGGGTYRKAFPR
jgi:hypothetical protein